MIRFFNFGLSVLSYLLAAIPKYKNTISLYQQLYDLVSLQIDGNQHLTLLPKRITAGSSAGGSCIH